MIVKCLLFFAAAFALNSCTIYAPEAVGAPQEAAIPPEIENEQILGINKEPWHTTLMPYATLEEAIQAKRAKSSYARTLNGTWKFHWVKRPEQRPMDFYKPDYDVSKWDNISVPSCWQLLGYGTPYYKNMGYTFQKDWPRVMSEPPKDWTAYDERNPVGSYRRNFEVPQNWDGRRVLLTFDGVDSAFYLWVNGKKVGYSLNSRNAADFDITPYIKRGATNTLAVEVYRYSSGSYLEDMDMWRLSGIFRNVTLWSAPMVHVRDFTLVTDLDSAYKNATLKATAKIHNYSTEATKPRTLDVTLYDNAGKPVSGVKGTVAIPAIPAKGETTVAIDLTVTDPLKWTAETPNLYTTVLSIQNGTQTEELISARTGFRKIEIKRRLFTINGVPVKLKGANRHENWPDTGHTVSDERMIKDIEVLKQANCNHVRTSHYSDDPRWYELCDEYGIYLVAEANVESHGYYGVLDHEPRYEKAIVDRNVANVENFKNHPSVVIWSLGNECGGGSNFRSALKAIKAIDTTRPAHYEPFGIGSNNPADIDSNMYTGVSGVEQIAKDSKTFTKPYYMCEYAHAMFNSMGSLGDYNDVFDKYPEIIGGAIWEWEDQGVWNRRDPKRQYLAYGGGFGEKPNDGFFIHKGVVFSDRSPKPHYPEVKRAYQWIGFAMDSTTPGSIKIKNKYAFTNLSKFAFAWTLTEDGTPVQSGTLPTIDLAPGKETTVALPLKGFTPKPGAIYYVNLAASLPHDESWAKAGYVIANGQFAWNKTVPAATVASDSQPLKLDSSDRQITVSGNGFTVRFDKGTGTLSGLNQNGTEMLLPDGGPRLHLWRAGHRNDDDYAVHQWNAVDLRNLAPKVLDISAKQTTSGAIRVIASLLYTGNEFRVVHNAVYTIYGNGSIAVDNAVTPQGGRIPLARIGVRMLLDKRMDALQYLARGPMENYSDRKRGSDVGLYSSSIADQLTPYSKPMECGNHEDAHWLALSGKNLPLLIAQSEKEPLQFSSLPYTDEELDKAEYRVDLPESRATVVCLSAKTLGVGSASCGPRPLEPYMVYSDPTAFSYVLRLLPAGTKNPAELARQAVPQDRLRPVFASRNNEGKVVLTADQSANIEYSLDGTKWERYTQPLSVTTNTTLHIRNTSSDGQSVVEQIPLEGQNDRSKWKATASTFEASEGNPNNMLDGDVTTFWHSRWSENKAAPPHWVSVDLGEVRDISWVRLMPRPDGNNGRIRDYELYLSQDGQNWGSPVSKGTLSDRPTRQTLKLDTPHQARYLKIVVLSDHSGGGYASIAEMDINPPTK